jgi:uncharacterized SAM-binding protein YcdF (DUF218 family)
MLNTFTSPLRVGVLLALLLLLVWRWLPRWARILAAIPLVICVGLSLPVVANALVRWQESRVATEAQCEMDPPDTIVLLSGGVDRQPSSAMDFPALGESSMRRVFAGAERFQKQAGATLVITGGATKYAIAEGRLMAGLAERLGVPQESIRLESVARTTWQNAMLVAELEPSVDRRIWLVTSALHLPRATYAFEQNGFEVCVWPADSRAAEANSIGYFLPSNLALRKSDDVIHEFVGEIAYRMGWLRSAGRDPWSGADER